MEEALDLSSDRLLNNNMGRNSSVGTATGYGLERVKDQGGGREFPTTPDGS